MAGLAVSGAFGRFRTAYPALRRLVQAIAVAGLCTLAVPSPATAQTVLALVNNRPVTTFDVEQRMRIAQLVERRPLDRKSALKELIDDQIKLAEARRIGYRVTEEGVEQEFSKLARASRQSDRQLEDTLKSAGLSANAIRDKIRADLAWSSLLRDRARRGTQISNEEVERELAERRRNQTVITEYEVRTVVFIVPRGSSPANAERAAAAARGRFSSCETGFDDLRDQRDVAVRNTVIRTSQDLPKALREMLDKTPIGRLGPPTLTDQGIEMFAVCGKRDRDNPGTLRSTIAAELADKRINEGAKAYLDELRSKAEIRYSR
jgi:peptidyl-prolyl cis-trans isomerase SurA